jgi:uncharacterized protein YegL
MKPKTKRRLQLLVGLMIFILAAVASYFSVSETGGRDSSYDIYLVLDVSGSMGNPLTKIADLQTAAVAFINTLNLSGTHNIRVGIVVYESNAVHLLSLTNDPNALIAAIQGLGPLGSTAMGDGIKLAVDHLVQEGNSSAYWVIVLMTDGQENNSHNMQPIPAADFAVQNHVVVHCIGFGSDAAVDLLRDIARRTGGQYLFASTGQDLISKFSFLASAIVSPALHYGSRILMARAIPIILFLPEIEKGASTIIRAISTTVLKRPVEVKGVKCPECGRMNRSGSRFCGACRTPLGVTERPCPRCGYVNRVGARYCGRCRASLKELMGE